jgi:glutaredoxin-related protein/uncharacterized membrane protein
MLFCFFFNKTISQIMYRQVLKYSSGIVGLFVVMLFGFSVAFETVVLKGSGNSFFFMTVKMIGELNAEHEDSQFKQMLLLLFIFLICIILLNMLIGIAVGELNSMFDNAETIQRQLRIEFSLNVQKFLFFCEANCCTRCCIRENWMISNEPVDFYLWLRRFVDGCFVRGKKNDKKDEIESLTNIQTNVNFNIKQTLNMIEINLKNTQAQFIEIRSSNASLDAHFKEQMASLKDFTEIKEQMASLKDFTEIKEQMASLKDFTEIKEQMASLKDFTEIKQDTISKDIADIKEQLSSLKLDANFKEQMASLKDFTEIKQETISKDIANFKEQMASLKDFTEIKEQMASLKDFTEIKQDTISKDIADIKEQLSSLKLDANFKEQMASLKDNLNNIVEILNRAK